MLTSSLMMHPGKDDVWEEGEFIMTDIMSSTL